MFQLREDFKIKYYFADFVHKWGGPSRNFFFGKKGVAVSPKFVLQKGLKIVFLAQKTPDLGPKNRLRIWGAPPSPRLQIFFSEKGVTDLGGTPSPPFTDKIRRGVFDVAPHTPM